MIKMPLSKAEKQRRYRRHTAGDHSLCDPERGCTPTRKRTPPSAAPPGSPAEPAPSRPAIAETFGARGMQLWDDMSGAQLGPAHRVLLVEGCRLTDRLDRIHGLLSGGQWLTERDGDEDRVVIVIDALLAEARQHASALRAIVAQLEPRPKAIAPAQRKGGGLAEVTALFAAGRGQVPTG